MTCELSSFSGRRYIDLQTSLSFYKEELAGETKNYVNLRAGAEQTSASQVLRQLVVEVLDSGRMMEALTAEDPELAVLWQTYYQVRGCLRIPPYRSLMASLHDRAIWSSP